MALLRRLDVCSTSRTVFRQAFSNLFPQDIYDRAWWPYQETDWTQITTSSNIETGNGYQPPLRAMRSACIPANASLPLSFPINSMVPDARYYVYVHFAEIQELKANQNLSSSGLTGGIPHYIQNLTELQYLNLNDNSLNGSVPAELVEKSKTGLTLSVEGNPNLCAKASCIKKKNKTVVPLVASVVSFTVLVTAVAILWRVNRRKPLAGKIDVDYRNTYQSIE
ncbi:hypothetical protein PVK06_033709 [Gossypium arboreum]|uniref:Malectin-like domain-containing protein n=1 Tax=Gossypium arboreum TaxID=29729 RepID=A0ABR0NC83_GOSAR|nr:hypothetical protein PVK06_033709 [Gossypium arboreum]